MSNTVGVIRPGLRRMASGYASLAYGEVPEEWRGPKVFSGEPMGSQLGVPVPEDAPGWDGIDFWVPVLSVMTPEDQSVLWEPHWIGLLPAFFASLRWDRSQFPYFPQAISLLRSERERLEGHVPDWQAARTAGAVRATLARTVERAANRWRSDPFYDASSAPGRSVVEFVVATLEKPDVQSGLQAAGKPSRRGFSAVLGPLARRAMSSDRARKVPTVAITLTYAWPAVERDLESRFDVTVREGFRGFASWVQAYLRSVIGGEPCPA